MLSIKDDRLVSIIMPAFNMSRFIQKSIESVLNQNYDNWELIIIDDGSTDNTKDLILKFKEQDHRIKYIYQHNGKQGKARNTGIENAKSDLIAFLDSDDLWVPEKLSKQIKLLNETNADMVFSTIKFIDEESNLLDDDHGVPQLIYDGIKGLNELIKGNCIPIFTVLAKKNSILKAGAFKISDELQYGEDYDLWLRMLLNGAKFVCDNEPLALYRKHSMQSSKLTATKYIQLLTIITNLPCENFTLEKKAATRVWLKRSMRYTKPINRLTIRKLSRFIPSLWGRYISIISSYFIPTFILRRIVFILIDLK